MNQCGINEITADITATRMQSLKVSLFAIAVLFVGQLATETWLHAFWKEEQT